VVAGAAPVRTDRRRLHQRLYDWVLHWAETRHGALALFLIAFVESSVFPIPPDVLLIGLVLGAPRRWRGFALICTGGSVLGGLAGYAIGYGLMDSLGRAILGFYRAEGVYEHVRELYARYDWWIVFTAAFTPIPYKVFTIASGAFGMNLAGFAVASAIGRGGRFIIVAGVLGLCGPAARRLIDRHFDRLSLALVVMVVLGFAALAWLK
jgi:membrane protein YqaA with SNARE-associated domain